MALSGYWRSVTPICFVRETNAMRNWGLIRIRANFSNLGLMAAVLLFADLLQPPLHLFVRNVASGFSEAPDHGFYLIDQSHGPSASNDAQGTHESSAAPWPWHSVWPPDHP